MVKKATSTAKKPATMVKANSMEIVKDKPMTKAQIIALIADLSELPRKKVKEVLDNLKMVAGTHLCKGAVGKFTIPGLAKFKVVRRPERQPRMGRNPFTGQPMMFKGKPASNVVKSSPAKELKEMV